MIFFITISIGSGRGCRIFFAVVIVVGRRRISFGIRICISFIGAYQQKNRKNIYLSIKAQHENYEKLYK